MTVNIQKCSNITVLGHHSNSNCKIVYNITTGEFYASVLDTSKILGVTQGAVSFSLNPDHKRTCKGMRLCYLSRIMEYLDEIQEANRTRTERDRTNAEKASAYDAIMTEQEAKRKAKAKAEVPGSPKRLSALLAGHVCRRGSRGMYRCHFLQLPIWWKKYFPPTAYRRPNLPRNGLRSDLLFLRLP